MLASLHIENIAVIENAELSFTPGLNVLTGETGAGKSIVIDSIGMMLGARTGKELLRRGSKRARVTGLFTDLSDAVRNEMEKLGIETEDGELVLEREMTAEGRTTARIGGRPATSALLRQAASYLLNIHGQHDTGKLLSDSTHLSFIDRCAALGDDSLLREYREKYEALRKVEREIDALHIDDAEKARKADNLRYHISKLEAAKLKPEEDTQLETRRDELRAAEINREAAVTASVALSGSDDVSGAVSLLREAANALKYATGVEAEALSGRLTELSYEAEDVAERVADMSFSIDPAELDAIENRLYTLDKLRKRYGATVTDMLAYLEQAQKELTDLESCESRLDELEMERRIIYSEALRLADSLHERRAKAAQTLSEAIECELAFLDMPRARFDAGLRAENKKALGPDGYDRAAFLLAVNTGEDMKPLSKVASGGELSRVMLALQNVLAVGDDAQTMIFDEIDAGISGRAAGKVAQKLRKLSETRQILCVTHLAQLAAAGHNELFIRKTESDGRTFTLIDTLDETGRIAEIARLLAGENITESVQSAAKELLESHSSVKNLLDS